MITVSARRPVVDTTSSEWSNSKLFIGSVGDTPVVQFLRIFYVTSPDAGGIQLARPYQLYARSFLPYKVSNRQVRSIIYNRQECNCVIL